MNEEQSLPMPHSSLALPTDEH